MVSFFKQDQYDQEFAKRKYMRGHIGEKHFLLNGDAIEIVIGGLTQNRCGIIFSEYDKSIIIDVFYPCIFDGRVKNNFKPTMYSKGYLSYGIHKGIKEDSKKYETWRNMFNGCYDKISLQRRPTYSDCYVSEEWHNFQNFGDWFDKNYIKGYHLDKDLLYFGNREYSKDKCIFIPPKINTFISNYLKIKENNFGWQRENGTWRSAVSDFNSGKIIYSKPCKTHEEAIKQYIELKKIQISKAAKYMKDLNYSTEIISKLR